MRSEKSPIRYDVDVTPEEILQIRLELAVIEKRASWLEVDQEVHVAVRTGFTPRDGAEDPNIAGAVALGDGQDLVAAGLQQACDAHVQTLSCDREGVNASSWIRQADDETLKQADAARLPGAAGCATTPGPASPACGTARARCPPDPCSA